MTRTTETYADAVRLHATGIANHETLSRFMTADYRPQTVPDHFILGPFVAIATDVDCDGTGYSAHVIRARTLDAAHDVARDQLGAYSGFDVMTPAEAREHDVDVDALFADEYGYATLGAVWNPWAGPDGDDSIGIPALDSRYDD